MVNCENATPTIKKLQKFVLFKYSGFKNKEGTPKSFPKFPDMTLKSMIHGNNKAIFFFIVEIKMSKASVRFIFFAIFTNVFIGLVLHKNVS